MDYNTQNCTAGPWRGLHNLRSAVGPGRGLGQTKVGPVCLDKKGKKRKKKKRKKKEKEKREKEKKINAVPDGTDNAPVRGRGGLESKGDLI